MRTRKFIRIFSALPSHLQEQFHLYLASPLHNTSQKLIDLAALIDAELIQYPENDLTPEELFARLDVDGKYRRNYLDKLLAQLLGALNDFLALQEFRGSKNLQAQMRFAAYERLQLDEWLPAIYKDLLGQDEIKWEGDTGALDAIFDIEWRRGSFLARQGRTPFGKHLVKIDALLEHRYLARKLELANIIGNYNRVFKPKVEAVGLEEVIDAISLAPTCYSHLVEIQYYSWHLITQPSKEAYSNLVTHLRDYEGKLAWSQLQAAWYLALNHCLMEIHRGNASYQDTTDELYLELLDNGYLLVENKMVPDHFKNILTLRLRKKKHQWVEEFITQYRGQLLHDYGGFIVEYALAVLDYSRDEYTNCIRRLEDVLGSFKGDIFLTLDARFWCLKSIYVRNGPDDGPFLESQQNAFRVFLIREKKLTEEQKKPFQHLNKLLGQLARLRDLPAGARKEKAPEFLRSLEGVHPLSNREWFRERIEQWTT